jgi:hypothetical protein
VDAISLYDQKAHALQLLCLIEEAWPENLDANNAEDALMANEAIDVLIRVYENDYQDFLEHEGITDSADNFDSFVEGSKFNLKSSRLLQVIELYHGLQFMLQYGLQNSGCLAQKFTRIAKPEGILLLRDSISNEIRQIAELAENETSRERRTLQRVLIEESSHSFEEKPKEITSDLAIKLDFGLEELFAHSLSIACQELEFVIFSAVRNANAHSIELI